MPKQSSELENVYHIYPIRCNERDKLKEYLNKNGIEALIHYPIPIHKQGAYKGDISVNDKYPVSELIANTELSLPIYPGMTIEMIERVIECLNNF